ncbi:MAG: hypothetical protein Q9219_001346 [cf. Caloplaca sp. 3 TL-2023]
MHSFLLSAAWLALPSVFMLTCAQDIQQADDGSLILTGGQPAGNGASDGDLTIAITNNYGQDLTMSFLNNAGFPGLRGDPQTTTLVAGASTSYAAPSGWAGRINVGKIDHVDNSKIEGSFYGAGNGDIDISYVDGYSVPITCSVGGQVVSGCNSELFNQGCNSPDTLTPGPDGSPAVCSNGARSSDWGPPSGFFAPCAGAAYTFPKDDGANTGMISDTHIDCCIGTSCAPSPHQQYQKRDIGSPRANAPSLLPRSQKLHAHSHGRLGVHGHKRHA